MATMDPRLLLECFAATLSPDQNTRRQAEAQLRQAETKLGFLGASLDILSSNEVQPGVKTATAVFFKNRIVRHWQRYADDNASVDNDEKPIIRERLLSTLVQADHHLRRQLVPVLATIVKADYPEKWPNLLDQALQLLYAQNLDSAYTGLLCFAQVCASFRWLTNEDRRALDPIIVTHFPTLLQVASSLLNEESAAAGEMAVLLLKCYKYVTYHDLPEPLQTPDNITSWGKLHVEVIQKELPKYVLDLDESERRLHPWVKAKKWAYANLYRLFSRYASQSLSRRFEYQGFLHFFSENFIPQLLQLYLHQVDQWCSKQLWISDECLFNIIYFMENCVTQKLTWPLIKPHFELLVSHFIFPLLCPTDSILEQFEDDPEDYIHTKLDIYDDNNAPDLAAITLLITLTTKKKKTTLDPISQFTLGVLNQYTDPNNLSLEDAKKLEGGMRLLGSLFINYTSPKSPYYPQMEQCLSRFILPHFNSKYPFIKARACEIASKFSDVPIVDEANIAGLYRGILSSFEDPALPVQLEAALALQSFVKLPQFQEALGSVVVSTMQKLLTLSNTIDAEAISAVMQELVEVFSEQLQPFGIDLMANLVQQFMRLAKELNDAANADIGDADGEFEDFTDKQMAALGLLNTMITVLLSFESSADIVYKLEECYAPVVEFVLSNDMEDFFREVSELIENSTFLVRNISPVAWGLFGQLSQALSRGIAVLYLEDIMPSLNNYLVYGHETIKTQPAYVQAFLTLFEHVFSSDDATSSEYVLGAEIGQKLLLALGPSSGAVLEKMLTVVINTLVNANEFTSSFSISMCNVIIAGLVYHCSTTLAILTKGNFILPFFNLWFSYVPKLKRVFDLKLSCLGLLSLVNLSAADMNALQITTLAPKFGSSLATIMDKLPTAMRDLEKKRKEFESAVDNDNEGAIYEGEGEWEDDEEDGAQTDDYLEFLTQEAEKLKQNGFYDGDDDDEELQEDPLANDVLDGVNVFSTLREVVLQCQSSDAEKYQMIFGTMTGDEQAVIKDVIDLMA